MPLLHGRLRSMRNARPSVLAHDPHLCHVSKSSVDTTLGSDGVGTSREELRDARGVKASLGETESGSQTGTTCADDDGIVLVVDDGVLASDDGLEERLTSSC